MPTGKRFRSSVKLSLILGGFLVCGFLLVVPQQGVASHSGPVFYVDANNPLEDDTDGDYHFHSLSAALQQFPNPNEGDTIILFPGRYVETVTVDVEGLIVKGRGQTDQTVLEGTLVVEGERVQLSNFTVDATGQENGVELHADKISLEKLIIFGAQNGILISGTVPLKDLSIKQNHIYHNRVGIFGVDFRYADLTHNIVEANEESGAILTSVYNVKQAYNQWISNGDHGLSIVDGRRLELSDEIFVNNGEHGGSFVEVNQMKLERATFSQNGSNGAELDNAQDNEILSTAFEDNGQAGLRLQNRSQDNRIDGNTFARHSNREAVGLWLAGSVYDNEFVNNDFFDNRIGIRLSKLRGRSPGSNRFEENTVSNSSADGLSVEASDGDNLFVQNRFVGNNGNGVYLAGRNDSLLENHIERSGATGIWIEAGVNLRLEKNEVFNNRSAGVRLSAQAQNNQLIGNQIWGNHREGIEIEEGQANEIVGNVVISNHLHGVKIRHASAVFLKANRIEQNGELGLWLEQVNGLDATANVIKGNHLGGIDIKASTDVDLVGNAIEANLHMGLRADQSEVIARRNWWGHSLGPAGAFEGRGNAVIGIELDRIVPWLPDEPQTQDVASVSAVLLDAIGPGEALEIDLQDRMGLALELSQLGLSEDGRRAPVSLAVVLLSKYNLVSLSFELPFDVLALYNVQVGGFQEGAVQFVALYDDLPEGIEPESLKLWWQANDRWIPLPGTVRFNARQVTGELSAQQLKPGLIALGTGSTTLSSLNDQEANITNLSDDKVAYQDDLAFSSGLNDLSLLGTSLVVLGIGRMIRKYRPFPPH